MSHIPVPSALRLKSAIDTYTDAGQKAKDAYHRTGAKFLRELAKVLGMPAGAHEVRSCKGGIAVLGEVILHSDDIYIQFCHGWSGDPIQILYRSVKDRDDCVGGTNNYFDMSYLVEEAGQQSAVKAFKRIIEAEKARKAAAGVPA